MRRWLPWLSIAAGLCLALGVWWDHGLQGWLVVQTGTNCGSSGPHYCYWSGFGSVMPWSLFVFSPLVAGVLLVWRSHTCHYRWWCWRRPLHPLTDNEHILLCPHHHPDKEPVSVDDALAHHVRVHRHRL